MKKDCPKPYSYKDHYTDTTPKQRKKVQKKPCWECKRQLANYKRRKDTPANRGLIRRKQAQINRQKSGKDKPMIADHQPTQSSAWEAGGCNLKPSPAEFKRRMRQLYVRPHCQSHSNDQGTEMGDLDVREVYDAMNANVPGLGI